MHDIRTTLDTWLAAGEPVALATVIRTWGSAPRPAGAKLAVSAAGIAGSVSAGCVEAAVIEAAQGVLETGRPRRLAFGVADETAWGVGLACGGQIELWVEALDGDLYRTITSAMDRDAVVAIASVVSGPESALGAKLVRIGTEPNGAKTGYRGLAGEEMAPELRAAAEAALLAVDASALVSVLPSLELFVDVIEPRPILAIVGAGHIAMALVPLAQALGYRTVVVDPRAALATAARFPSVDRLVVDWPDAALGALPISPSTAIAVLSHDPKIDDPAVAAALTSPAFYVGALGSRRTQAARRERLSAAGMTEAQIDRLHGPIGLDIGAKSPEEIALSIVAELTAVRRGRAG